MSAPWSHDHPRVWPRMALEGRASPFRADGGKVWNRRRAASAPGTAERQVLPHSGHCLEPVAEPQWRGELSFVLRAIRWPRRALVNRISLTSANPVEHRKA